MSVCLWFSLLKTFESFCVCNASENPGRSQRSLQCFFLEMFIFLTNSKCGKQLMFALHRHVQQKNPIRNCYSNQLFAPRHIQKLVTSVAAVGERERENQALST